MLAGKVEPLVGPRPQYDLDRLAEPRRAFLRRHAKGGEFDARKAAAGAPIDPAAGQHIEQRHLLGEPQGMVEWDERHRRADAQPLGSSRCQSAYHMYRGTDAEAAEVMLGEPDRVIAGPVHDLDPLQSAGVDRGQIDPAFRPAEKLQNPELHRCTSSSAVRQNSRAARAHRSGWSRLTPCPYAANSSSRPFGNVSAKIFCCSEAIRLRSPLSSSTGI